jgi:hypothetical protein
MKLALYSTRVPKAEDIPCWRQKVGTYTMYHFGYDAKARYSNKHCGCAICFQESEDNVLQFYEPSKGLEGGCGAVRFKQNKGHKHDICIVSMYWPEMNGPMCDYNECVNRLVDWLCQLLQELPQRCTPIIALDGNFKLGYDNGVATPDGDAVGCNRPDQQSHTRALFRAVCNAFDLKVDNTVHPNEPFATYDSAKSATRVDYLCSPKTSPIKALHVLRQKGLRLPPYVSVSLSRQQDHNKYQSVVAVPKW